MSNKNTTQSVADQAKAKAVADAKAEAVKVKEATARIAEEGAVQAEAAALIPKAGPEVEGQGKRAHYIVTLGYPLWHPFQNKMVKQGAENAVELEMDYWVSAQLEAKLIAVVPKPE